MRRGRESSQQFVIVIVLDQALLNSSLLNILHPHIIIKATWVSVWWKAHGLSNILTVRHAVAVFMLQA